MQITPDLKIGNLLNVYPQLDEILIDLVPAFKKLKNPVLRKTVAKVTSLRQAAGVGGISVTEMVNQLRQAVGQSSIETDTEEIPVENDSADTESEWVQSDNIYKSFDAREMIESGEQPLGKVMSDLRQMPPGKIYELITPFEPAPLIDQAKLQGFKVLSRKEDDNIFKTYFRNVENI